MEWISNYFYLRTRIWTNAVSVSLSGSFAAELDITPAYLSDIEKGNRYAPKNYLDKLKEVLKISEDDEQEFEDLASVSRGSSFEDINCYLGKTRMARVALRRARDSQISDDEWEKFINDIDKSSK